jgi:hypothetical protein
MAKKHSFPCVNDDCEKEFPTLKQWREHMGDEHSGFTDEDVIEAVRLGTSGGGGGDGRAGGRETMDKVVAVRLRVKDVLALEELGEKRNFNVSTMLRQLLLDEVERNKPKPETAEKLCADTEALAQRWTAFGKTGEPKSKAADHERVRGDSQRLSETMLKHVKRYKGEKTGGGFWEA